MKQSMKMGMDKMQSMPMSGDTDKDFASMMKMHHQQGVEMAQMEIANGKCESWRWTNGWPSRSSVLNVCSAGHQAL